MEEIRRSTRPLLPLLRVDLLGGGEKLALAESIPE